MFVPLFSTLLVGSLVTPNLGSGAVYAAPALNASQVGSLQCNLDRDQVVKNLAIATKNVSSLTNSPNVEYVSPIDSLFVKLTMWISNTMVSTAQEGLDNANTGVQTIAQALKQGKTAPANARMQVEDGLTKAQAALSGANLLVGHLSFMLLV